MIPAFKHLALTILGTVGLSLSAVAQLKSNEKTPDPADKLEAIGLKADPAVARLVPWPMRGEVGKSRVVIPPNARIVAATKELEPLAEILAQQIMRLSGRALPPATGAPKAGDILLRITPSLSFADDPYLKINPALKGFEHRISATAKGCLIEGVDYQATALATSTLLQSLEGAGPTLSYPVMNIEDKPASTYAGLMLDVARQFHPAEVLKDVIDLCQFYKIPYFHLHLTDDQGFRLPSKSFPKVPTGPNKQGILQSYTEEEMRELVAYGDARGVTLVPELELPGHSGAIQGAMPEIFGALDEATGKYKGLGVINIANEAIYPVLEKMIEETCDIFKSSPYFHIGGDECDFSQFNRHPQVQKQLAELESKGVIEKGQHFSHFLNRIHEIVKKQGKKTFVWEGFGTNQKVNNEILMFAWHGQSHLPQNLLQSGFSLVNIPWIPSVYNTTRENYEWNMWKLNLNEHNSSKQFDIDPKIIGGTMVLWARAPEEAIGILRLKTPARHERLHSPYAQLPYEHFSKRLKSTDAVFDKLIYPFDVKLDGILNSEENAVAGPVTVSMTTLVKGAKIRYVINKPHVTLKDSSLYNAPFEVGTEHSKHVTVKGYYGPRTEIRLRAFDENDKPIGAEKWVELRFDPLRIDYKLMDLPPGQTDFVDDTSKLKVVKSGKFARYDGTMNLAEESGPRILEARATVEFRASGDYVLNIRELNAPARKARIKFGDGQWLTPDNKGLIPLTLPAGTYPVIVQQVSQDGNIGVEIYFEDKKFVPDPEPNPRKFWNRRLHYWMKPL